MHSNLMTPRSTMSLSCKWEMLLMSLWIQVGFVPGMHGEDGTVNHLSREDVWLLKDEQDLKCFTRTHEDFTCFFETADNKTYDLLYNTESLPEEKRCDMSVQKQEEGTFLHICHFPGEDVLTFVETEIKVVEHSNNSSILFNRTVSVEDQLLLDPPFNVSLDQNGQEGQLLVSWHKKLFLYCKDMKYRIRYSSKVLGEKTKILKGEHHRDILDSLVPGEETEVQVSVKCAPNEDGGLWSSWSHPVRAMVPQSADDVSLICYTSDLQNLTCQWNTSRYDVGKEYKVFYKIGLSKNWTECLADGNLTDLCGFRGKESSKFRIMLISSPAPLSRTFYTPELTLEKSIKTPPPGHLRKTADKNKLCIKWDAPLPSLSAHLQYEVGVQTKRGQKWMTMLLRGPETGACVEVSTEKVRVRAKPAGSVYSGYWSDWSDVITSHNLPDTDMLLMLCIPVLMLMLVIIPMSMYLSKLKQYFWPPVPNLDKVLQGFLTEINRQRWDPSFTSKLCCEETTTSVVEIMSEEDVSGLGKPSEEATQLLSPEGTLLSDGEKVDGSPRNDAYPDYVTLSKDSVFLCPKGNKYMYEKVGEKAVPEVGEELVQTHQCSCADGSVCVPPCSGKDMVNHSYVPLVEAADTFNCGVTPARGPGNLYINLPCS